MNIPPLAIVWGLLWSCCVWGAVAAEDARELVVYPESLTLKGSRSQARIVVLLRDGDRPMRDVTAEAEISVEQPALATVTDAICRPVQDGSTGVQVNWQGVTTRIPLQVKSAEAPDPVSFRLEVLPILTRHACNSGGCHGSPSGKGGLRMSLFAFDPKLDVETLTREESGRRINPWDPDQSLMLIKPLMKVPHGGGMRLPYDSSSYQILRQWIADGGGSPQETVLCDRIEILPGDRELNAPHWRQNLIVVAHHSDGHVVDVTHLADFFSSDEGIAKVSELGQVQGLAHGESAIVVRYLEHVRSVRMTFLDEASGSVEQAEMPEPRNYVDQHVFAKLSQMRYPLAGPCSDSTFARRVHVDLTGRLPLPAVSRAFVADHDPQKRARLIERLLQDPNHARYWASHWADLFRVRGSTLHRTGVDKFYEWIVQSIRTNQPYDQFVRDILTASGDTFENPPANFFRAASSTDDCTETTCQTFLGIRIQCAKCHNHPYERWTQDNYYGLSAFFHRVERVGVTGTGSMNVWVRREGTLTQPRTGAAVQPWLPDAGTVADKDTDARWEFVDWLCSRDNPFLARMEANRIWSHLMGRGIVDPIDDFRHTNPPSNPKLLEALASDFVEHDFDRRHLLRTILNSRTYQLASTHGSHVKSDDRYFGRHIVRRLAAEQIFDAICDVTGVGQDFEGVPSGTPVTQLAHPELAPRFLKTFGKPERNTACACERSVSSDLSQVLEIVNGSLVDEKIRGAKNRIHKGIEAGRTDGEMVDDLFWHAFSRGPDTDERASALQHLRASDNRVAAWEDLLWVVLNRKEFLFHF